MYIVTETNEKNETSVKGVHRQVKAASVQAWTLNLTAKLREDIVEAYISKGSQKNIGPEYKILCWDDRPDQNVLNGTWYLRVPASTGKDPEKRKEVFRQQVESYLEELKTAGRTPSSLWNSYMSHEPAEQGSVEEKS